MKPETFAKMKGAIGARPAGSNAPPMVFQRDYAYAMPMIFKNATILTELALEDTVCSSETSRAQMEALDTISQFYIRMYGECRQDNITGLSAWREVLDYLGDREEGCSDIIKAEVFGLFNSFITLSLFVYMFSSKGMAISSPDSIDESCYNLETFLSLLSVMEDDKRKEMLSEIRKLGIINPQVDLTALYKQGTSYLEDIKKDQEQRYGNTATSAGAN